MWQREGFFPRGLRIDSSFGALLDQWPFRSGPDLPLRLKERAISAIVAMTSAARSASHGPNGETIDKAA